MLDSFRLPRALTALFICLAAALAAPAVLAQRLVVDGQAFDTAARIGNIELKLNGAGLRQVAWFKAYAAGLYLPDKTRAAAQALNGAGPKRLQMRMMQDVPTAEFIKAFDKGIGRNSSAAELAALKERMARFDLILTQIGQVKKGDVVNLDFIPGQGLVLTLNGKPRGEAIAGEDLYAAFLRIFIGDKPTDERLKASLLGAAWS